MFLKKLWTSLQSTIEPIIKIGNSMAQLQHCLEEASHQSQWPGKEHISKRGNHNAMGSSERKSHSSDGRRYTEDNHSPDTAQSSTL